MAGLHNSAFETLFDPSSPSGSTASANSYLSFSALADFRSPQDSSGLEYLEKWQTGSQRPKMDEAAFSDLFFSNPSPFTYSSSGQTDTGMSPWALSPASFGSADAGIPNLPLPQASCSSLGGLNDVLFPEIDLLDAVDPYDCSMSYPSFNMNTRNHSLSNKASNESMLSASSAQSDFLLTPRHATQKMNHGWDDLAVLPSSSGSSIAYVERVKDSRSGSSSSAWSGGVSLEMEGTNYGDMTHNPGTFPIGLQDFSVAPATDGYALDTSGANAGFMGQNLDWVIEQHPEASAVEKKKVDENGQLLPAACIVGNVPGWQASSPTYPSLLDFDNASAPDNLINFKTEPLLSVVAPRPMRPASTGPASSVGQASAAMLGTPMTRRSRSSHGVDNRNSSSLFAFHPVDHSSGSANSAAAGPSTLQAPAPFYHPQQFLTPPQPSGLSSRRSVSGLSIQTSMVAGSDAYSNPCHTSTSTVSNMIPTYINTAPMVEHIPFDSHYDALAGPMSAPLYPSYDTMLPYTPVQARRASPVPAPASVLQPAPGNINVAPPLSADLPPPVVAVEVPTPRATSHKQVEVQPVLTSAPLVMPKARSDAPAATPRTIAALPTKRKVTAPKPRKTSGKKGGAAQPFCSFINFTADDADVISAGVAPSGSKNKRKVDDSASPTDSNKRSRQSDSP